MMCVTFLQFLELPLFVKFARCSKSCLKFVDNNRDYDHKTSAWQKNLGKSD